MPEFLELCRLLASVDTVHTYIDADDDDYVTPSVAVAV